jgi:hypothetical protein
MHPTSQMLAPIAGARQTKPSPIATLHNLYLLLKGLEPVIYVHGLHKMQESGRLSPLKFALFITLLGLWCQLVELSRLHINHLLHDR